MEPEARAGGPLPFLRWGIAQLGFVVPDLEAAVEHWWRQWGIGPWHFYTYGKPLVARMSYRGEAADHRMRVALANAGPMRIELIEPLEGDTVYAEHVQRHGYGLQHIGVLVDDMAMALAQARRAGLEMVQDGAGFGRDGDGHYAYFDTAGCLGVMVELIERPAGRVAPEKVYPPEEEGQNPRGS